MLVSYAMDSQPRDWLQGSPMGESCAMVYVGPNKCLECGKRLDGASDPFRGSSPSPGDFSICIHCGHVMVFGDDMKLRQPTDAECVAIAGNKQLLVLQRARADYIENQNTEQEPAMKMTHDELVERLGESYQTIVDAGFALVPASWLQNAMERLRDKREASYVRDDKGVRHTHCHGVPAEDWFGFVREARSILSDDARRMVQGIMRIVPDSSVLCSDPDCKRLNRIRGESSSPVYADFQLTRDIEPVHPADPEDRDIKICEGHPWKAGSLLCSACARVALAKRLINSRANT